MLVVEPEKRGIPCASVVEDLQTYFTQRSRYVLFPRFLQERLVLYLFFFFSTWVVIVGFIYLVPFLEIIAEISSGSEATIRFCQDSGCAHISTPFREMGFLFECNVYLGLLDFIKLMSNFFRHEWNLSVLMVWLVFIRFLVMGGASDDLESWVSDKMPTSQLGLL